MSGDRSILGLLLSKVTSISVTVGIVVCLILLIISNVEQSGWVRFQFGVTESNDDSTTTTDSTSEITTTTITDIDENVYSLLFWNLVKTLWESDVYYGAIAVFILSLLFTFLKMFLVMIGIWVPITWSSRATMLSILLQIGKIAMTIVFFMIFLINAVHQSAEATVSVSSSTSSKEYDVTFELSIEIEWALILFTITIICLMIITEIVSYLNKKHKYDNNASIQFSTNVNDIDTNVDHQESHPTYSGAGWEPVETTCCGCCSESMTLRAPLIFSCLCTKCDEGIFAFLSITFERVIMVSILAICLISLLCCLLTEFMRIEYTGDIADYLDNPIRDFQFHDFGIFFSNTDNYSYSLLISIFYEIYVVAAPLKILLLLLLLWFVPFPNFIHIRLRPAIWFVNAWNMLDLMVIVSLCFGYGYKDLYEMVIDDEIGSYCDELEDYIGSCAGVKVTIKQGTWWALVAVISMWISVIYAVYFSDPSYKWNNEEMSYNVGPELKYQELSTKQSNIDDNQENVGLINTQV